jgi:hypothetical protein
MSGAPLADRRRPCDREGTGPARGASPDHGQQTVRQDPGHGRAIRRNWILKSTSRTSYGELLFRGRGLV